jgi:hypothetical protein
MTARVCHPSLRSGSRARIRPADPTQLALGLVGNHKIEQDHHKTYVEYNDKEIGKYYMIYYRVALQADRPDTWRWRSTILTSLDALFGFLKLYSMVPRDHIRIFFSSSVEYLNLMLDRENQGLASNSITAEQLLKGRRSIHSLEIAHLETELGAIECKEMVATSVSATQSLNEKHVNALHGKSSSSLDIRRLELELGSTGDHDLPYEFTLPASMPQALAWADLLVKVYLGKLEP